MSLRSQSRRCRARQRIGGKPDGGSACRGRPGPVRPLQCPPLAGIDVRDRDLAAIVAEIALLARALHATMRGSRRSSVSLLMRPCG